MFFVREINHWFNKLINRGIILLKRGQIDILIDSKTPCLLNRLTGEIVDTCYEKLDKSDLEKIKKKDGWKFGWTKPYNKGYTVYALRIKGDNIIQGLVAIKENERERAVHIDIVENAPHNYGSRGLYDGVGAHLFAIAIKVSRELGYGGFVYFEAKTNLIEYYKTELGAKQIGSSQLMLIEEQDALKLLEVYFPGGEEND